MLSDMLTADGAALLGIFVCIVLAWLIQGIIFALIGTRTYYGKSSGGRFYWSFSPWGLVTLPLTVSMLALRLIASYNAVVVVMQGKGFWLFLGFLIASLIATPFRVTTSED